MIKAIIFDEGGVLSKNTDLRDCASTCARKYGKDPKKFSDFVIETWNLARVDDIDSDEFWKRLAKFIGKGTKTVRNDFVNFSEASEGMLELAKKLRKNYKIGILSNQIRDWLEELVEELGYDKIFDVIVGSYSIRKAKPDKNAYLEIASMLGVRPDECVFIDNLEKNLPSARELGMKAILFKDIKQLKKDLMNLKIKF